MLQRNRSVRLVKSRCFFDHPRVYTPWKRVRDLREGGRACGVLCGRADWAAAAEPDVCAELPGYGCARSQLGEIWRRSGLEEAVERSEVQAGTADGVEHYEPGTSAAGTLADPAT
jgi:hypothetical protein